MGKFLVFIFFNRKLIQYIPFPRGLKKNIITLPSTRSYFSRKSQQPQHFKFSWLVLEQVSLLSLWWACFWDLYILSFYCFSSSLSSYCFKNFIYVGSSRRADAFHLDRFWIIPPWTVLAVSLPVGISNGLWLP